MHERDDGGGEGMEHPMVIHKREDGRFACPFCGHTYQLAKSTRYHIQRRHPGRKCHVLQKPGRAVGLTGEAKLEHVRKLNREANRRYQARMRAMKVREREGGREGGREGRKRRCLGGLVVWF